ncbi:hypothetical protein MTP99_004943 [Tenebrio molitor]|nr:hypothetical protein MTP99_004943 [Tenebrio molitor]
MKLLEVANKLSKLSKIIGYCRFDSFAVVHGDDEPANFLFKCTDKKRLKLDQVCFLDFQMRKGRVKDHGYDDKKFICSIRKTRFGRSILEVSFSVKAAEKCSDRISNLEMI